MTSMTKKVKSKPSQLFIETTRLPESLEGVNSSLSQSADKLWLEMPWMIYGLLQNLVLH